MKINFRKKAFSFSKSITRKDKSEPEPVIRKRRWSFTSIFDKKQKLSSRRKNDINFDKPMQLNLPTSSYLLPIIPYSAMALECMESMEGFKEQKCTLQAVIQEAKMEINSNGISEEYVDIDSCLDSMFLEKNSVNDFGDYAIMF